MRPGATFSATVLLILACHIQLAAGACPFQTGAKSKFIDPATPADACNKDVCVGKYEECCGSDPNNCVPSGQKEQLQLVFSDEFDGYSNGAIGAANDVRWTAMDFHYSSDKSEEQNYKPENVAVKDGKLLLSLEDKNSTATRYGQKLSDQVEATKTSGMLQSWNKFCFTGGLVEFDVKLPGDSQRSGFWAAAWLMGNLGRAGYYPSLEGMWPFSYDSCADGNGPFDWNDNKTQRISRCNRVKGRGAPEIDVLEYGVLGSPAKPQYVHTMQMAPVLPPNTTWMRPEQGTGPIPGIKLAGQGDTRFDTFLGTSFGALSTDLYPRTGSRLTDTYTASSYLKGSSYWEQHHKYSLLWMPGQFVRWYLDDKVLFEVNQEALKAKTNKDNGLTVEERLIPLEPMYIIMNLAMSDKAWAKVDDSLQYPGVMSVDSVRVWQLPGQTVGCDAPGFPTSQYISCNRELYLPDQERGVWKLPYCKEVKSGENQFLLGLAGTVVVVVSTAIILLVWMGHAFKKGQELQQQAGQELSAGITRDRTHENKSRACYINKEGRDMEELLERTRPDLLAAAKAKQEQG